MEAGYTKLRVWQFSYALALDVYKTTALFPKEEKYGLISQMQRSGSSVPCNIAEGYARISRKEKVQFYSIARGSLAELQTQLMLAKDIGYLKPGVYENLIEQSFVTYKLLNALIKSIQQPTQEPPTTTR